MDEKNNLIQLFMSGGENMALAFEINKSKRILTAKEIEGLLRKFLKQKGRFVPGEAITVHNIAKKYNLFPLWRKLYPLKKRVYVSSKRLSAHNAVLCTEWQCRLFSRRQYTESVSWYFYRCFKETVNHPNFISLRTQIVYISWLMQCRITTHMNDYDGSSEYIFEDVAFYEDGQRKPIYVINKLYKQYIELRKQYGYISEPISNVFK